MSDVLFTDLPTVSNSTLADIICAVQTNISSQETLQQIFNLMLSNTILDNPGNPNGVIAGVIYQFCWDTTGGALYVCTTTGSISTAIWTLISSGSLTLPVSMANGGTNKNNIADLGAIPYSTASQITLLASTSTANRLLMSGSSAAPIWSTATYPVTTSINRILYSSDVNQIAEITTSNSSVLVTNATGTPSFTSSMTNGQLIIGSTGSTPIPGNITAGTGITVTNGAGTISISVSGSGVSWTEVTTTSQIMTVNGGYISNNAGLVTLTLPTSASIGDILYIVGKGAGGWLIAQNASQSIHIGSAASTIGVGGSVASTNQYDSIQLVCTTANTTWTALGAPQSALITIV